MILCVAIVLALPTEVKVNIEGNSLPAGPVSGSSSQTAQPVVTTTSQPTTQKAADSVFQAAQNVADKVETVITGNPTGNKEIIEQYTLLVNKFKQEKPLTRKRNSRHSPKSTVTSEQQVTLFLRSLPAISPPRRNARSL